jgi:NADP-dependent 3-hydroxy acid dehydrogenase YdfG
MTPDPYAEKIVLDTGASSGMGKATAIYLAGKGVKAITLFARGKDRLDEVANEIKAMDTPTKTLIVVGDASKVSDNQRAVDETVAAFGGINSAFVNAGIFRGQLPLADTPDDLIELSLM